MQSLTGKIIQLRNNSGWKTLHEVSPSASCPKQIIHGVRPGFLGLYAVQACNPPRCQKFSRPTIHHLLTFWGKSFSLSPSQTSLASADATLSCSPTRHLGEDPGLIPSISSLLSPRCFQVPQTHLCCGLNQPWPHSLTSQGSRSSPTLLVASS